MHLEYACVVNSVNWEYQLHWITMFFFALRIIKRGTSIFKVIKILIIDLCFRIKNDQQLEQSKYITRGWLQL